MAEYVTRLQSLDRTQPILSMTHGQAERGTHDCVRHGVTSLLAYLDVATGRDIGKYHRRHRHQEFLKFHDPVDATLMQAPGVSAHIVLDNCATYKTPAVKRWFLAAFRVPSALHPDEQFVAESGGTLLCRVRGEADSPGCVQERGVVGESDVEYLEAHDADAKPFRWVADADAILDRIIKIYDRTFDSGH